MGSDETAALRAELESVERNLAEVRATVAAIRQETGSRSDGPGDPGDVTSLIAGADEQEELITVLEQRRDRLRERLGDPAQDG